MVDTVKLYSREFSLSGDHRFTQNLLVNASGEVVSQGGWKFPLSSGWMASVSEKQGQQFLFVDGSLPRLLYGSGLHEVKESDYDKVSELLTENLKRSGINLPSKPIETSFKVSRVDFCRNLTVDHSIPSYLSVFAEYSSSRQDKSQWNAETLLWSNTRREFTMYDKVSDLLAKENTYQVDQSLRSMPHNILRLENRYKRGSEVKKVVGSAEGVRLSQVFDGRLSRRVLTSEVDRLLRSDKPVIGSTDLAEMVSRSGGRIRQVVNAIGARGVLEQVGYDGDRLLALLISRGTPRSSAFRYRSWILDKAGQFLAMDRASLIQEVKTKLRRVA